MNWYLDAWKKYAVFSGRATRTEYWWFYLWNTVAALAFAAIDVFALGAGVSSVATLSGFYSLAVLLPSIAITARRLHDTGRSAWWMFVSLVPLVGTIALMVFLAQDSKVGSHFGESYTPQSKAA